MRILVVCAEGCRRQYDASKLAPGSKFHCACGEILTVPLVAGHDSAVIRCSACGGPRQGTDPSCRHCSASFTLAEQDLHTVCPSCMTRVSDRARFCHHCAVPLAAEGVAGEESSHGCPSCKGEARLMSRRMGGGDLTTLECHRCAGMWLGLEVFGRLEEQAQAAAVLGGPASRGPASAAARAGTSAAAAMGKPAPIEYRPCPVCQRLMHRKNYGQRSGVIVDSCADHGFWFDQEELTRILLWIKDGGLDWAKARTTEDLRNATREARRAKAAQSATSLSGLDEQPGWTILTGSIFDIFDLTP